jgi:hypothetical protein
VRLSKKFTSVYLEVRSVSQYSCSCFVFRVMLAAFNFAVASIALWIATMFALSPFATSEGGGLTIWYSVTWLVFLISSIVFSRQSKFASPTLFAIATAGTLLTVKSLDTSAKFGHEFFGYTIGVATIVLLVSRITRTNLSSAVHNLKNDTTSVNDDPPER